MNPSYAPHAGRLPVSETVTSWDAPAARVTLLWLRVTRALESLESGRTARENAAAAPLTLVIVRLTGCAVAKGPKEIAAGSSVAATFTASAALSLPAPASVTCTPPCRSGVAVFTTADLRRPGCFKFGFLARAMAATPAANGTA